MYALSQAAEHGAIEPRAGLERLSEILRTRGRFGAVGTVVGHAVLTLGLAMVLRPSLENLLAAALLGAIVGVFKLVNRGQPVLAVPTPVLAAALVSSLVFLAFKYGLPVDPVYMLVPPLITFLPGAMLTLGMVELAYGEMVSGTSRLVTGFVQLVLLAFGLAAGAVLVGFSPDSLVESARERRRSRGASGGRGRRSPCSASASTCTSPRRSGRSGGCCFVLLVAVHRAAGDGADLRREISGFFGMLVATPLGYLIQLRFRGPPAMVTFLPSFWLVVPGSLGLRSVTHLLSDRAAGLDGLVTAVFGIASIALGTLIGASIYKAISERFGSWQTQIGRVKSYVRRTKRRD